MRLIDKRDPGGSEPAEVGKAFSTQLPGLLPLLASFFTFKALYSLSHIGVCQIVHLLSTLRVHSPGDGSVKNGEDD